MASARTRAVRVIAAANDERSPRRSCASPATTSTLSKTGSVEPGAARDREARLREQREEADGLHRDALAARVRAREEEKPRALGQLEVERHGVRVALLELSEDVRAELREAPVEKGMARGPENEPVREVGEDARDARRELRARLVRVELREHLDGGHEVLAPRGETARQRHEDAVHLLALLLDGFGERVVVLDDERAARRRSVWPEPDRSCRRPPTWSRRSARTGRQ